MAPAFDAGPETVIVEIYPSPSGSVSAGGFYRGKLVTIGQVTDLAVAPAWADLPTSHIEVAVFEVNGIDLEQESRYVGWVYGMLGDKTIIAVNSAAVATLTTRNKNLTQSSTTTLLEFDQATGIRVDAGATPADPDVVSINPTTLATTFTYNVNVNVPTCLSIILTKTNASTLLGGQTVLHDVTAALTWKTIAVGMLSGTTVGVASYCVTPVDCCPAGPRVLVATDCCPDDDTPADLTLTISGTGGGSFPSIHTAGQWETGSISFTGAGAGTIEINMYCSGSTWEFNSAGGRDYTVTFSNYVITCNPFSVQADGLLSGAGSYSGETRTFTATA